MLRVAFLPNNSISWGWRWGLSTYRHRRTQEAPCPAIRAAVLLRVNTRNDKERERLLSNWKIIKGIEKYDYY